MRSFLVVVIPGALLQVVLFLLRFVGRPAVGSAPLSPRLPYLIPVEAFLLTGLADLLVGGWYVWISNRPIRSYLSHQAMRGFLASSSSRFVAIILGFAVVFLATMNGAGIDLVELYSEPGREAALINTALLLLGALCPGTILGGFIGSLGGTGAALLRRAHRQRSDETSRAVPH